MAWSPQPPPPDQPLTNVPSGEDADWLLQRTSLTRTSNSPGHRRPSSTTAAAAAAAAASASSSSSSSVRPSTTPLVRPATATSPRARAGAASSSATLTPQPPSTPNPRASLSRSSNTGGGGAATTTANSMALGAAVSALLASDGPSATIPSHLRLNGPSVSGSDVKLPQGIDAATTLFFGDAPRVDEKIIMLGEAEVGKTSLWRCLRNGGQPEELSGHVATIGSDYWQVDTVLTREPPFVLNMRFWDTAGQERFNSLVGAYLNQAQVVVFVFDLTVRLTFDRLNKHWIPLAKEKSLHAQRIYVGNKADESAKRFASKAEILRELGTMNDSIVDKNYIETSCLTGANVAHLFHRVRTIFMDSNEDVQGVLTGDKRIIQKLQKGNQSILRLHNGDSSSSSARWPPTSGGGGGKAPLSTSPAAGTCGC